MAKSSLQPSPSALIALAACAAHLVHINAFLVVIGAAAAAWLILSQGTATRRPARSQRERNSACGPSCVGGARRRDVRGPGRDLDGLRPYWAGLPGVFSGIGSVASAGATP